MKYAAAVITCSDQVVADLYEDRSGPILCEGLSSMGFRVLSAVTVPDNFAAIQRAILDAIADGARVVLTAGGTGVGPRDVTVDATAELLAFEIPGLAEAVRGAGSVKTRLACLSRGLAGVIVPTEGPRVFIFNAPGTRGGARDCISILNSVLSHIVEQLDGADHDINCPGHGLEGC